MSVDEQCLREHRRKSQHACFGDDRAQARTRVGESSGGDEDAAARSSRIAPTRAATGAGGIHRPRAPRDHHMPAARARRRQARRRATTRASRTRRCARSRTAPRDRDAGRSSGDRTSCPIARRADDRGRRRGTRSPTARRSRRGPYRRARRARDRMPRMRRVDRARLDARRGATPSRAVHHLRRTLRRHRCETGRARRSPPPRPHRRRSRCADDDPRRVAPERTDQLVHRRIALVGIRGATALEERCDPARRAPPRLRPARHRSCTDRRQA